MHIILNGKQTQFEESATLDDVISSLELPKFFVVELNKKIVYKEDYKSSVLKENDEVELAIFTGGG